MNGTLASKDQILSGTPTTPTLLKYGIVRSKLTDNSTRDNAIANETDFGLKLSWRGSKIEASEMGPSTPYHYVTFQFSTSENVFNVELRDKQNFFQKCTAVLTLFLSVMGALRTMKCAGEKILDTSIVLMNEKLNKKIPEDVLRRKRILDEHVLTKEGTRRLSMLVGGGSEKPQKQRRLSSRELELMKKEQSSGIELVIRNGDNDGRLFDNPMKKSGQTSVAVGDVALKQEIVALKKEIVALKKDNIGLKQDIIGLKREMKQMKEKNKAMDNKIAMILASSMPSSKTLAKPKTKTKKWKSAKNKLKSVAAFKQRRRSSLMTSSAEVDFVNNVHVDVETGREYSIDPTTGAAEWLVKGEEEEEEEVHVDPASGRKYNSHGWL